MDTFDSINLGVFVLIQFLLLARMTFWKRHGQLIGSETRIADFLLSAIACLSLSLWHHWTIPHHHDYEIALASAAVLVSYCRPAERQLKERQKAKEKQAQTAGRRYY